MKELVPGMAVKVFYEGNEIDEGTIVVVDTYGENKVPHLEVKSSNEELHETIEFVSSSGINSDEENWTHIFDDPMQIGIKCYSSRASDYKLQLK